VRDRNADFQRLHDAIGEFRDETVQWGLGNLGRISRTALTQPRSRETYRGACEARRWRGGKIVVGGGRGDRKSGRRHASGGAPGPQALARGFRPWAPPGGIFVGGGREELGEAVNRG
jgi:hypothetical protein